MKWHTGQTSFTFISPGNLPNIPYKKYLHGRDSGEVPHAQNENNILTFKLRTQYFWSVIVLLVIVTLSSAAQCEWEKMMLQIGYLVIFLLMSFAYCQDIEISYQKCCPENHVSQYTLENIFQFSKMIFFFFKKNCNFDTLIGYLTYFADFIGNRLCNQKVYKSWFWFWSWWHRHQFPRQQWKQYNKNWVLWISRLLWWYK